MTTANRFETARFLADNNFIKILKSDTHNRISNAIVPGHQSKSYEVIIRRPSNGMISTECLLLLGHSNQPCIGGKYTVCYHAIAVLIASANELDIDVSFCNSNADAQRLVNLGGEVKKVYSFKGGQPLWMVFERPEIEVEAEVDEKKKSEDQLLKELGY